MSAKLDSPKTAPKTHWSIISRFFNKSKMQVIPTILSNGKLASDFKIKFKTFSFHIAAQCTPVKNASTLPKFKYRTDKCLNSFTVIENDIFLITKSLNADKAHGWDNIYIRMIQLCGKTCLTTSEVFYFYYFCYLEDGIPVHKKESKNLIKSYRPISLLSTLRKIFERLIFNSLFNYLMQNRVSVRFHTWSLFCCRIVVNYT